MSPSSLPAAGARGATEASSSAAIELAWWPLNALQALATVSWSAFWISVALALRVVTGRSTAPLWLARWVWSPFLVRGSGARVEVHGAERLDRRRPCLLVTNHSSQLDIPLLFGLFPGPLHFLVKEELLKVPFLGAYLKATEMVMVPRGERSRSLSNLGRAVELLRRGRSLAAFPEGTRSRDGRLRPFKTGVFLPAIEAGAPIVPVAIRGADAVLPADGFRVRPGTVHIDVGEPIPTHALGRDDRHELAKRARAAVSALLAGD